MPNKILNFINALGLDKTVLILLNRIRKSSGACSLYALVLAAFNKFTCYFVETAWSQVLQQIMQWHYFWFTILSQYACNSFITVILPCLYLLLWVILIGLSVFEASKHLSIIFIGMFSFLSKMHIRHFCCAIFNNTHPMILLWTFT